MRGHDRVQTHAHGVEVTQGFAPSATTGDGVLSNSIHWNVGLGIDLSPIAGSANPNDPGDADAVPTTSRTSPS